MRRLRLRAVLAVSFCALVVVSGTACKSGPDDAAITTSVKAKMAADPTVPMTKISVDTKDGVVTLTGEVDNDAAKQKAESIAKGVEGVKSVKNQLTVKPAAPPPVAANNDTAIQKAVQDKFTEAKISGVTVAVSGGVATLTGTVPKGQMQKAVQAAMEANPKPTRVVNQITEK
jgi:hyperosmotically inducible periplasmic protein